MFVREPRAPTLSPRILRWDIAQNYQTLRAASGGIRHDARMLLHTKDQALGNVVPDGQLSQSRCRPADDPFVEALVLTKKQRTRCVPVALC